MAEFYRKKKKICQMCAGKSVDYKDADIMKKYISADKGKILPRRITGACSKHQRHIANEVKKARFMAKIPFDKKYNITKGSILLPFSFIDFNYIIC